MVECASKATIYPGHGTSVKGMFRYNLSHFYLSFIRTFAFNNLLSYTLHTEFIRT
jgi:hypothetical protein